MAETAKSAPRTAGRTFLIAELWQAENGLWPAGQGIEASMSIEIAAQAARRALHPLPRGIPMSNSTWPTVLSLATLLVSRQAAAAQQGASPAPASLLAARTLAVLPPVQVA